MFRLHDKHPIFNRSVLGSVSLFAIALLVPWVLAESWSNLSQSKPSSSTHSPQSGSVVQPSSSPQLSAAQESPQRVASNSISGQPSPNNAASAIAPTGQHEAIASNAADSKRNTNTAQNQSVDPKTNPPQTPSTAPKTATSPASKPAPKTQSSDASKPNKQQSKSQNSKKTKANASPPPHRTRVIEMRVAIANGKSSLVVGTSTAAMVLNGRGNVLGRLPMKQATNVVPNGSNIRIGKWETPGGVWVKPAQGGLIFVGDRWYRGNVLLVSQGSTLLAVNYVELEDYIASVVGCEVSPSWPIDALKAQAIAARSYALVHYLRPAHSLYHLGNTQRWQVYGGINSEWNTTRQAAEETRGVFLSYKGGVVESLYAANDEIVTKAHGGKGMSQNGALSMAQQGYNYLQILSKYYPGTSLAWIDAKASDTH